jgi:hypothetical protein
MGTTKGKWGARGPEADSSESRDAVATITRLIAKLYPRDGASVAVRKLPDDELIKWSDVIRAVRK